MLGRILAALSDPGHAEAALALLAEPTRRARIAEAAAAEGVTEGEFVAAHVRHALEHATEEVWLDLLGRMARSVEPGVVAVTTILELAFPATMARQAR